jgi:hypothetical protein
MKASKEAKKIRWYPPDPPHPFSHRISTFPSGNCWYFLFFALTTLQSKKLSYFCNQKTIVEN